PGTEMFMYWPGRKARSSGLSSATLKLTVVSEWWVSSLISPSKSAAEVLATSEVVGTSMTRSDSGSAWQVRMYPSSSSSSVIASSIKSPGSKSPETQNDLQVPQAPSRQSEGKLIRALK